MFQIDPMSRTPIYEQIIKQLERFILSGTLSERDQIPSVRNVSVNHSVNPVTILKAYNELDAKGIIHAVPGRGYFVCEGAVDALSRDKLSLLAEVHRLAEELALAGIPAESLFEQITSAYSSTKKGRSSPDDQG